MRTRFFALILAAAFLEISARGGIVQSATYTPQGSGDLSIDLDTLAIQGNAIVDWMVFNEEEATKVHSRKIGSDYLVNPVISGATSAVDQYDFSWSNGDPVGTGSNVSGLGFAGFGTFQFKTTVPVGFSGIFRLYVDAAKDDNYTIGTIWAGDNLTVNVAADTFGYIDIAFSNDTQFSETITMGIIGSSGSEPGFYAAAIAQIPEPAVIGLVGIFGLSVLFLRRTFNA